MTLTIHKGMIATPALPRLRQIADECDGEVVEMVDFTNCWPNRNTDPGDRYRGQILVAQGWDGGVLYGVTTEPRELGSYRVIGYGPSTYYPSSYS